jgi:hypothetical protein
MALIFGSLTSYSQEANKPSLVHLDFADCSYISSRASVEFIIRADSMVVHALSSVNIENGYVELNAFILENNFQLPENHLLSIDELFIAACHDSLLIQKINTCTLCDDQRTYVLIEMNLASNWFRNFKIVRPSSRFLKNYINELEEFKGLPSPYNFHHLLVVWENDWFQLPELRTLYLLNFLILHNEYAQEK